MKRHLLQETRSAGVPPASSSGVPRGDAPSGETLPELSAEDGCATRFRGALRELRRLLHPLPLTLLLAALLAGSTTPTATAHSGGHPSIHDTVATIVVRMKRELTAEQLIELTVPKVEAFLTPSEREILGTEHVRFRVNVPVVVTIVRDSSLGDEPFWLAGRGFKATGLKVKIAKRDFDTWEKEFPAGEIGLGVHSLTGRGNHYLVLLKPQQAGSAITVTDAYPAQLRTARFEAGVEPYADQADKLPAVPAPLEDQLLVQTVSDSGEDARLVSLSSRSDDVVAGESNPGRRGQKHRTLNIEHRTFRSPAPKTSRLIVEFASGNQRGEQRGSVFSQRAKRAQGVKERLPE